eukprot:364615-Chlamydomonas_euryale.AAC.53
MQACDSRRRRVAAIHCAGRATAVAAVPLPAQHARRAMVCHAAAAEGVWACASVTRGRRRLQHPQCSRRRRRAETRTRAVCPRQAVHSAVSSQQCPVSVVLSALSSQRLGSPFTRRQYA